MDQDIWPRRCFLQGGLRERVTYIHDGGEGVLDVFLAKGCNGLVTVPRDVVGHVGEQFGEIGDFEDLIQGEELQSGDPSAFDAGGERTVGKCALGLLLDDGELGRAWIGEAIG